MTTPKVATFFYGSYMNAAVLAEVGLVPERLEAARLDGYDIRIEPRANLVRSAQHSVYGAVAWLTHAELARLYAHSESVLGERYLPEPVLTQTLAGEQLPALCYVSHTMTPRPATDAAYVERILTPARDFGFPAWYLERIASFAPDEDPTAS